MTRVLKTSLIISIQEKGKVLSTVRFVSGHLGMAIEAPVLFSGVMKCHNYIQWLVCLDTIWQGGRPHSQFINIDMGAEPMKHLVPDIITGEDLSSAYCVLERHIQQDTQDTQKPI